MKIFVNGAEYEVAAGQTILDAALSVGEEIPTLCYERSIGAIASCRVCVVEVSGRRGLVTSCNTPVAEGMQIITNSEKVLSARRTVAELLMSDHQLDCMKCERSFDCRLRKVATALHVDARQYPKDKEYVHPITEGRYIQRNNNKCINCGRCIRVCKNFQQVGVIATNGRGFTSDIGCAFGRGLGSTNCIACGQCVANCPTGALCEVSHLDELKQKLEDPNVYAVVATAPSTRVALGEGFGLPAGTNVQGKMVAALRRLGFNKVFDLDLGADFTIMEEGAEFLGRLKTGKNLPQFTSCCPAWINYVMKVHPELKPNISSAKSPMGMFGALVKTYYAKKAGIDPKNIYCVMLMPCIAKQSERDRLQGLLNSSAGAACCDIDLVVSSRSLMQLINEKWIDFAHLPDEEYDDPMSLSSGAGLIFGTTGGVAEAAIRTVSELYLKKRMDDKDIEFKAVRDGKGVKEAEVDLGDRKVKIAVVSGIANAEKVICDIKDGKKQYDFIEVMACPGGCVNGGGQPVHCGDIQDNRGNARVRADTLYKMDKYNVLRRSHENPAVKQIYKEFLGEPNSEIAHKLLHTKY
jgi:NADP-reducing hydrogenase subunit HndD